MCQTRSLLLLLLMISLQIDCGRDRVLQNEGVKRTTVSAEERMCEGGRKNEGREGDKKEGRDVNYLKMTYCPSPSIRTI
jgi:hypothetical protein